MAVQYHCHVIQTEIRRFKIDTRFLVQKQRRKLSILNTFEAYRISGLQGYMVTGLQGFLLFSSCLFVFFCPFHPKLVLLTERIINCIWIKGCSLTFVNL